MACNISKNDVGEIIVRADNGQPSQLYKHLKATLNNEQEALRNWALTKTPEFQAVYGSQEIYVDINGEPSMMYVQPDKEFLRYGAKDKTASAKAKDKLSQEDLDKAKLEIEKQTEFIRARMLNELTQFRVAESQGAKSNRYFDIANRASSLLRDNPDAVKAISDFTSYGLYYLKEAKKRLDELKTKQDTNAHLETLNELSQFLIIFDNLQEFNRLTGKYEKPMFHLQMTNFFEQYGIKPDKTINYYISTFSNNPKRLFQIKQFIGKELDKTKLSDKEKAHIIKEYEDLIINSNNITSVLDDINREKDELRNQIKNDYYSTLTDWLWPYVEENQINVSKDLRITKKDYENFLKKAKKDAGSGEYFLASLSTIDDPIAQTIRLAYDEARQKAHRSTIDDMSSMATAAKEEYGTASINEAEYLKFLKDVPRRIKKVDEEGNEIYETILTKALITPFLTERLEEDRNTERVKQVEYFTKIEDDKISKLEAKTKDPNLTDKQRESALLKFETAQADKDYNIRKNVSKAMNAWYETKYDIIPNRTLLIEEKKLELNEEDFKLWYSNNIYMRVIPADELELHKRTRGKFRMIHPENLQDLDNNDIKNSSYYKPGRTVNGKVVEYYVHEIYYGGEFTTPKVEYADPRYNSVRNNKFHQELSRVYNKTNSMLPPRFKLKHGIIPQTEKDGKFWNGDKTVKENLSKMWDKMDPDIYADTNEIEVEVDGTMMKVSRVTQNVDGSIVKTIPVKFVSILDEQELLNTNLMESFSKFSAVVNRYKELSRTEASARALKNVIVGNPKTGIQAREVVLTNAKGTPALSRLRNATDSALNYAVKDKGKRINNLIIDYIDDVWYGDVEEKENLTLFGKDVSLNKLGNFTSKWVSIQRLAGNLDSAISNLVIGRLAIFNESIAGRYYTLSEYYEASKIINKELFNGTVINDYMQEDINKKSLFAQMMIRHDAIQGELSNEYGIKVSKKTALEMSKDFLFFSQNGMEYTIQKRSMLCVSKGFKVQLPDNLIYDRENDQLRQATSEEIEATKKVRADIEEKYKALIDKQKERLAQEEAKKPKTKKEIDEIARNLSKINKDLENIAERKENEILKLSINYFTGLDAYTRGEDGAIKVKDFLAPYFTPKVENQLRRRIQELNKKQQGIYAQQDKSQAQRHWLGKLALMFRKYLYSAYEHRFGDRIVNLAMGEETYGYQRQFLNKLMNDYKTYGNWAFKKMFDGSASVQEQYAINKTITEYATWASFMVLFWLLRSLNDDDDEKNWALSKTAYIVKRTEDSLSEFALPFGIGTLVRTFKNPFSAITLIEQVYEVMAVIADDPLNFGGTYQRDSGLNKKGDSKFWGKLLKVAPILRQWGKFWTPEDQLKYYTQKKLNV